MTQPPHRLSATEAAAAIADGTLSSEALTRDCLARIGERDPLIRAWVCTQPDAPLIARNLDREQPRSKLHGIPIGVKDVIQTADMPTEYNSAMFAGHRPGVDAACIAILRAAGAVILGKTDTVEFAAIGRRPLARNPHDPSRTPGGSSSGSGAAVADFHVPIALGTQTGGSTLRPGSFCGIFAMKPTWGAISREGLKHYSVTLDTLGLYARDVRDFDLLCDVFNVHDDEVADDVSVSELRIAVCRGPNWASAEPATRDAMTLAARCLTEAGARVVDLELPNEFSDIRALHTTVMNGEGRAGFLDLERRAPHLLSPELAGKIRNELGITNRDLVRAYDRAARCRTLFDEIAAEHDAVLTPSAIGEAPVGLHSTGDARFNSMWTLLHVPVISVPVMRGPEGMPVGLTLTAPRFHDRRLLKIAAAFASLFTASREALPA